MSIANIAVKFITWAASPVGLLCLCALLGWLATKIWSTRRWGAIVVALGIVQLAVFALPITAYWLNRGLEQRAHDLTRGNIGGPYVAILLLGGLTNSTNSPQNPTWQANLTEASDRAVHAAKLWHQKLAPRIIVSGGTWPSEPPKPPEARWMSDFLVDLGVPDATIFKESQSTTTRENMRMTASLMQQKGWQGRLALVTSASHTPRAVANAMSAGLTVDAFPTDWQASTMLGQPLFWLPDAEALQSSTRALKEWIAIMWRY